MQGWNWRGRAFWRGVVATKISVAVVVWKKIAPKGNSPIRRCDLVGIGVVLLEEVCHCGGKI